MAKKTIQIDLTTGLRATIERPVAEIAEVNGVRLGEVTILNKTYCVRHSAVLNQWRLCDANGRYQRVLFDPTMLKETAK